MDCQDEPLVQKVWELYEQISSLESLKPSKDVNIIFTKLVLTCMPPNPIDVTKLCKKVQEMRSKLIRLCGEAEGLLQSHFSTILGSCESPLGHLNIFPYYSNYLKLSLLEFNILSQHYTHVPSKIAFVGSGALLMLRSAHRARAFLYLVLDPSDLYGFEVLSVFHPANEVISSVVIARKYAMPANSLEEGLGPIMLPI
uniref:Nicotianamine synthase n=1 Tax=Quercus lobata TaxID=97700 RepID=A0A7N2L4T4_QUELO